MAINFISKRNLSVANTTEGLNLLLSQIVTLICENTGLTIINKIDYGSEQFEGYPIYNTKATDMSSNWYSNLHQSDIYILGLNENNYCMIVNICNGVLNIALGCSMTYGDRYADMFAQKYPTVLRHNPLTLVCYNFSYITSTNFGSYWLSVPLIKNENDIINLTVGYYTGDNSQGFKFVINGIESEWLLFTKDDNGNKFAMFNQHETSIVSNTYVKYKSNYNPDISQNMLVIPFSRNIPLYQDMLDNSVSAYYIKNTTTAVATNTYFVPDMWFSSYTITNISTSSFVVSRVLSVNYATDLVSISPSPSNQNFVTYDNLNTNSGNCPMNSSLNFPKLQNGKCYLRKLFAPNSADKFNLYLWYSPVTERPAKNSFYLVGNDIFLLVKPYMTTYAVKV